MKRFCGRHFIEHERRCPVCANERWAEDVDRRGASSARGYDGQWRKVRRLALERDYYLCQHCLARGAHNLAELVDHVIPIRDAPHLRLALNNLQSLCVGCHAGKTARDQLQKRKVNDAAVGQ